MPDQISSTELKKLRNQYPIGCRVELIYMSTSYYTSINPGTQGTVDSIDDKGTIHVFWDSGHLLGVVYGKDFCQKLNTVTTICYDTEKVWNDRVSAEEFFFEAMMSSEGSEKERYSNVYFALKCGLYICKDTNNENES